MAASHPLVSVIIPTYNYGHVVCEAVESVLHQTYTNLEVIVVDDGSQDDTRQRVEKYRDRIRYVYQPNKGLSAARNTGIKEAKGDYIAILDSDDIWLPTKIEEQMKVFAQYPEVGLISCSGIEVDENGKVLDKVPRKGFSSKKELMENLISRNVISGGSNAIFKKECISKVGLFDEDLNSAEDWDMWLRIANHYDVKVIDHPLVKMRVSQNSMSSAGNAGKMLANEIKVINKYFSGNGNLLSRSKSMKRKALSYRYSCAAWAYMVSRNNTMALKHILMSFFYSPLSIFTKRQAGLMARIFLKSVLGFMGQRQSYGVEGKNK